MLDENWKTPKSTLEQMLAQIRGKYNEAILVAVLVGPDDKNSAANILQVNYQYLAFDCFFLMVTWNTIILVNFSLIN